MKCGKCGHEWKSTGLGGANPYDCPNCTYEDVESKDFRDFRRKVFLVRLAAFQSENWLNRDVIEAQWDEAGTIARAEPKGE